MESTLDTPPSRDAPAHMPEGAGPRIATAARRLLRRKPVIVGSARASAAVGQRLFRKWPVAHSSDVAVLDAYRMDGQLIPYLRRDAPDEVYFDLGANLDEHVVTRVGAALLMDGTCVRLVLPQAARPPVQVETASLGTDAVVSLHLARRSGMFRRVLFRFLGRVGAARERTRMDIPEVEAKVLREHLHILLRTLPAVIQQRGAL